MTTNGSEVEKETKLYTNNKVQLLLKFKSIVIVADLAMEE